MKSISHVIVIKKTRLSRSKLRIIIKIILSVWLINKDSLTFFLSLSLSLPCCYQWRFKRYKAKETNSKTEETVPLCHQPVFPTTCQLSFLFRCGKPQITWFVLYLFLFHFDFFLSLKITSKNIRDLTFRSFFLSFFLIFFLSFCSFFFFFHFNFFFL